MDQAYLLAYPHSQLENRSFLLFRERLLEECGR
jgi:hypothetical protein